MCIRDRLGDYDFNDFVAWYKYQLQDFFHKGGKWYTYVMQIDVYKRQYYINATQIALEIGLGNRTNTILQSAFFRITGVIPVEQAVEQMKKFIVKDVYKRQGYILPIILSTGNNVAKI